MQAKLRIESLERQLVWREEKLQGALAAQRELKQQVENYHADFEREKTEIFDISADMTRQYKGMQVSTSEPASPNGAPTVGRVLAIPSPRGATPTGGPRPHAAALQSSSSASLPPFLLMFRSLLALPAAISGGAACAA